MAKAFGDHSQGIVQRSIVVLFMIDCHYRHSYNKGNIDCNRGWGLYYTCLIYIIIIFPCLLLLSHSFGIHSSHFSISLLLPTFIQCIFFAFTSLSLILIFDFAYLYFPIYHLSHQIQYQEAYIQSPATALRTNL